MYLVPVRTWYGYFTIFGVPVLHSYNLNRNIFKLAPQTYLEIILRGYEKTKTKETKRRVTLKRIEAKSY
jgi:hypothetical protein